MTGFLRRTLDVVQGPRTAASIDFVLLAPEGLLVIGWCATPGEASIEVGLPGGGSAAADRTRRYTRDDVARHLGSGLADREGYGFVARVPMDSTHEVRGELDVRIAAGGKHSSARGLFTDPLPEALRAPLLQQWQSIGEIVVGELGITRSATLLAALARHPDTAVSTVRFHFEYCARITGLGYFVIGWLIDPRNEILTMTLTDGPNSVAADVLSVAERTARPDVLEGFKHLALPPERPGIVALLPATTTSAAAELDVVVTVRSGEVLHERIKVSTVGGIRDFSHVALGAFSHTHSDLRQALDRHIGPALEHLLQARITHEPKTAAVKRYGELPPAPRVSVIVPLYGRHDFMRVQLALFADDPSLQDAELIYVVDDPRIYDEISQLAPDLAQLFRVPFATVYCGQNLGFAGANNLGVAHARGEFLCLLNSDVMPRERGWLPKLVDALKDLPDAGIVAPLLLFEDGSVQHAGMDFEHVEKWDLTFNRHPAKGLTPAKDTTASVVPAVTAACLVTRTSFYRELGGLDEGFLIGDFEDSDFCVRASTAGQHSYIVPSVALYHLERQSQMLFEDRVWREKVSIFNAWRQTRRLARKTRA